MLARLKEEKQRLLELYSDYLALNDDKKILEMILALEEKFYPQKQDDSSRVFWAISLFLVTIQILVPSGSILKLIILVLIALNSSLYILRTFTQKNDVERARQRVTDKEKDIEKIYDAMLISRELIFELIDEAEQYQNSKEDFESILSAMLFLEKRAPSNNPRMKLLTNNPINHEQS